MENILGRKKTRGEKNESVAAIDTIIYFDPFILKTLKTWTLSLILEP